MTPLAPFSSSCFVRPHRGLSPRNDGSHSITPFRSPASASITRPALHSCGPSLPISLRRAVRSAQSTSKLYACASKSP
jgi:hypothetical protein